MTEAVVIQNLITISAQIEELVRTLDIDYIEACIIYCERNDIEPEQLADILKRNQNIKAKIQIEAENLHFIKKTARITR